MRELEKVLGKNEAVLWEATPNFWPWFLSGIFSGAFLFSLVVLGAMLTIYIDAMRQGGVFSKGQSWQASLMIWVAFSPILYLSFKFVCLVPIKAFLEFKRTYYAVTTKRVFFQGGVVGRDFETIDVDNITSAEVRVDIWDMVASVGKSTGSVHISSTSSEKVLWHIANPYEVFKFLNKVGHDIKTDIQYPNALRPSKNPGYKTEYNPKKE